MGRSHYRVLGAQPHFITCSTVQWMPIFSKPELLQSKWMLGHIERAPC
jgi:putative transposase